MNAFLLQLQATGENREQLIYNLQSHFIFKSPSHKQNRGKHKMTKKLLIDVDCGVDDAQAIMMALAAPDVQILGITCVHGNTSIDNVCKNVLRVLKICKRLEIPVFRGASAPILSDSLDSGNFHGEDGLGDFPDPEAPGLDLIQKEQAVQAMIRIVTEHEGQVCLVATAPLTNLALAVKIDPSFHEKLKSLFIMGGNMESRGNTTVCGEFNFAADPEAAYIVLKDYLCPTYIATWEYTYHHKLPWGFCHSWMDQNTEKARFMKNIFAYSMEMTKDDMTGGEGFLSCDSYAMAAAIDEEVVTEYIECAVSVELSGKLTRGMMVLDTLDLLKKKHKAFVMKTCDLEKFQCLLMAALK
ncbi:pyrimidine-specific ribonucleoside hydrolase RihA-like [Huso huso]|uniref:Pyrimidine-specific ribonucleoside hydrolase RihA-like n=1 Tax=Huso huso TaxID=61971 RepID=A0ABR0ZL34_HUSHU